MKKYYDDEYFESEEYKEERRKNEERIKHLEEREERRRPFIETPITDDLLPCYENYRIELESLGGNYIEEYIITDNEVYTEEILSALSEMKQTGKYLPGIDPRTGVYGPKAASVAFFNAAVAYYDMMDYDKASANLSKAIEINPRNIHALYMLSVVKRKLGDFDSAIDDIWDAIQLNPIYRAMKDEQSRETLEKMNSHFKDMLVSVIAECYYTSGRIYEDMEDPNAAELDYSDALKYNPDHSKAFACRGCVHMEFDQDKEAVEDFTAAIRLDRDDAFVYEQRAKAYIKLEKFKEAIADFDKCLSLGRGTAHIYMNRANCFSRLCDYRKSLEDANRAVQLLPDKGETYFMRAVVYVNTGEYDKAISDLNEAERLDSAYAVQAESIRTEIAKWRNEDAKTEKK
jgi:tetratricopeptide (TPR) repeat protein